MALTGQQLKEEADRFEADPFYADTSKNRLDISQHLTENNRDLSLQELQGDIVFDAADKQEHRVQELKNLALLCQSNANKLVKIFGQAHATSDINVKVQQALKSVTSLLSDRGINEGSNANLGAMHAQLHTLQTTMQTVRADVDKVTTEVGEIDFAEARGQITDLVQRTQNVKFDRIEPTIETLERKIVETEEKLRACLLYTSPRPRD